MSKMEVLKKITKLDFKEEFEDVYDSSHNLKEGQVLIINPPKFIKTETYLEKIKNDVYLRKPGIVFLVNESFEVLKDFFLSLSILAFKITEKEKKEIIEAFYPNIPEKIIGITGSCGKTSISYFLYQILEKKKYKTSALCSVGIFGIFQNHWPKRNTTTPSFCDIRRFLYYSFLEKVDFAILEVTSHALDQERLENINFYASIFTNLFPNHLDYHETLEKYFQAKLKIFEKTTNFAIFGVSIPFKEQIIKTLQKKELSFDFVAGIEQEVIGIDFPNTQLENISFIIKLMKLMSISCLKEDFLNLKVPEGRMELVGITPKGSKFFIDFGHFKESVSASLKNLVIKEKFKKIFIIIGQGGEKDRNIGTETIKEIIKMKIGTIIITEDNPKIEENMKILFDLANGHEEVIIIPNRWIAIETAINLAGKEDIIISFGRGNDEKIIHKNKIIYLKDRDVFEKILIESVV